MKTSEIVLSVILLHIFIIDVSGQQQPVKVDLTSNGSALNVYF